MVWSLTYESELQDLATLTSQRPVAGLKQQLFDIIQEQDRKLDLLIQRTTGIDKYIQNSPPRRDKPEQQQNLEQAKVWDSSKGYETFDLCSGVAPGGEPLPLFYGPTSSFLSFGIVKRTLMVSDGDRTSSMPSEAAAAQSSKKGLFLLQGQAIEHDTNAPEELDSYVCPRRSPSDDRNQMESDALICGIDVEEAKRLIQLYDDIVGSMYPIVDIASLYAQADQLFAASPPGGSLPRRHSLRSSNPARLQLDKTDINIIRMVLAIALLGEGRGASNVALQLYTSLYNDIEKILWGDDVRVGDLKLLALVVCNDPLSHHLESPC